MTRAASPRVEWLGTPNDPIIRFRWGVNFGATLVRISLRPAKLLAPHGGSDRAFHPADEGFYFRAFDGLVTLSAVGYHYGGN